MKLSNKFKIHGLLQDIELFFSVILEKIPKIVDTYQFL